MGSRGNENPGWSDADIPDQSGRVVIVTGASEELTGVSYPV